METVNAMYSAFAKGDIPFILEHVADNFVWHEPSEPAIVPYGGTHMNTSGFLEFFQLLEVNIDTTLWEVDEYIYDDNNVVATGKHGFVCKKSNTDVLANWAMIWRFKNGELVSGKGYYDTAATENAFRII